MSKPIPFTIQKNATQAILVQVDQGKTFYPYLHHHSEYQLTTIIKGSGIFYAGHEITDFQAGSTYLIGSDVPHVFQSNPQKNTEVLSITLFFTLDSLGLGFFDRQEMVGLKQLILNSQHVLALEHADGLAQQIATAPNLQAENLIIGFLGMLSTLRQSDYHQLNALPYQSSVSAIEGQRLQEVLSFIFQKSHRPISIEEIAQVACLSRSQFSQFFKRHTNKTFIQFLTEYRIEQACQHLMRDDLSMEQIAFTVGFQSAASFSRQFQARKNSTPTHWRKQFKSPEIHKHKGPLHRPQ